MQSTALLSGAFIDRLRDTLRAFRHRNYRLYFTGQAVSLTGAWMQQIAMSWLVYRLTGSALLLGVVSFSGQIAHLLVTPFAGVLADRFSRHRILVIMQALAMIQASALAFITLSGTVAVWHLVVLSLVLGIINATEMPVRQSFIIELVGDREGLANAIALNSALFNGTRMIGPSIAGIVIAFTGEGLCFLINAASFLAVIAALLAMRIAPGLRDNDGRSVFERLNEGLDYVTRSVPIRSILLLMALISFMGLPYIILMPVFTSVVLGGGPETLGFLMGATGMGAFTGALLLAMRRGSAGLGEFIGRSTLLFSLSLVAISFVRSVPLALPLFFLTGFGMISSMASCNTVLQSIVVDDKRGRVMSFFSMALMGFAPFGNLLAGAAADRVGSPVTIMTGGILCAIGAVVFSRKSGEIGDALLGAAVHTLPQRAEIIPD
jgi:MFS family permease